MKPIDLVAALDAFFDVASFIESDWLDLLSEAERGAIQRFLRTDFMDTWNGLMLDNTAEVESIERAYLVVFPSQDVLDTIIAREVERGAPGALVFAHHPLTYSEHEATFKPIPTVQLEEFQEHRISFYSCHAPLDCHTEVSTATALADALGLEDQRRFGEYYSGLAGVHGQITPTTFQSFAGRLAQVCELAQLRYDQCLHNGRVVKHVAVAPGGGGDPAFIDEAMDLGVDTYVTGHWWLFGTSEFAAENRLKMCNYVSAQKINLVGASHYSSELVVMRDQMPDWFRQHNIETVLIRQEDPWQ